MTEKTKATLYLEENLVQRAKESDLNMSEIANNALKERFGLEKETNRQKNLRELLQNAAEDGRLYSFPFKIETVKLENIRKFEKLSIDLEDGINLIYGPNGSGKSTVIESIVNTVQPEPEGVDKDFLKYDRNSGDVEIELESEIISRNFVPVRQFEQEGGVLLVDSLFANLDREHTDKMMKQLSETVDSQVIIASVDSSLAAYADNKIKMHSFTEERKRKLQNQISALEVELDEKKKRAMEATNEIDELETRLEELQESKYQMESLDEEREEILDSIHELETEIENTKGRLESVEEQLEEAGSEREKGRLEERKENLSEKMAEKEDLLDEYRAELEEIENQLIEIEEVSEEAEKVRSQIEHKRNVKHDLEDEIKVIHEELEELKEEYEEVEAKVEVTK
ncbi:MAG: ATP-binding protein [Candidatus Aenigmatarchaeota archaeon]